MSHGYIPICLRWLILRRDKPKKEMDSPVTYQQHLDNLSIMGAFYNYNGDLQDDQKFKHETQIQNHKDVEALKNDINVDKEKRDLLKNLCSSIEKYDEVVAKELSDRMAVVKAAKCEYCD